MDAPKTYCIYYALEINAFVFSIMFFNRVFYGILYRMEHSRGTENRLTIMPHSGNDCRKVYVTEDFFLLKIFVITRRSLNRNT